MLRLLYTLYIYILYHHTVYTPQIFECNVRKSFIIIIISETSRNNNDDGNPTVCNTRTLFFRSLKYKHGKPHREKNKSHRKNIYIYLLCLPSFTPFPILKGTPSREKGEMCAVYICSIRAIRVDRQTLYILSPPPPSGPFCQCTYTHIHKYYVHTRDPK